MNTLCRFVRGNFAVGVVMLGLFSGGCMPSDKSVISQADSFHGGIKPAAMSDPQLAEYIQTIGDRVIAVAKKTQQANDPNSAWMFSKDMQFHLVNSKTLNAFTTGGEHMYVYNELFQQCKSEDELAAVVAHEFGHIYGRHVQKGMRRQYITMGAAAAAGGAGYVAGGKDKGGEYAGSAAAAALAAGQFVGMSFTRGDEAQADQFGFDFYTQAGWDPNHFGDFFQHMIDLGYDKGTEMLSDHPSLKSRVEVAKKQAAALPPQAKDWRRAPVADANTLKQLQAKAQQVAKTMPDDSSLQNSQKLLAAMPRSCLTPAIHEDQKKAELAVMADAEQAKQAKQKAQK
ncbi:MAG: M48 family metallopeptidase [Planctomycetota bacterium]|nr:M48 family metallopeptidase [Planctomycetota bacterium]